MSDMNKEKRAEIIQDALDYLDDDMIESVDSLRSKAQEKKEKGSGYRKGFFYHKSMLAVAASVCLLIIGAYAWENYIGPSDLGENAPLGTESGDKDYHEPENAPGLDEDVEGAPEGSVPDIDINIPVDTEGDTDIIIEPIAPGETGAETSESEDTSVEDPHPGITESEEPLPPEEIEPVEPDHYPPLGDAYQLTDNYVKVTMLPHKAWDAEVSLAENFAKSVELEQKYYQKIDAFVEALCITPLLETGLVLGDSDLAGNTDMYYLFFQRTDGEIVQVGILGDNGLAYFYDNQEYCMKIDGAILYEVLKVLWVKW